MADISRLEEQANLLMNNVSGWEQNVLTRIGKRIKKYGKLSLADVKSINNIATVKQDMEAITKELAKVTGYNISQIEQMYGELLEEQHLANQPLYDYRGKTFVPFAENRELQAIVRAYAKTTGETMINLAKTKALCIMGANGKPIGMQKYYTDILDKAVMQVTTGSTDFHTAMRDSIIELGGSGVRVDYGGGVTRRLDTVVRQNLLWGAKQASTEYNTMIGEELGCDGIEVDFHSNPRPSHEFMQGKQYVLGKARTINGVYFESADEALERLQDYGCLHYKTPIICGISEPRYSAEELKRLNEQNAKRYTIDGKEYSGYEVTQMQRRLESAVREQKTIRDTAKASGDNILARRCNERIKVYQNKYNEIFETTGIAKQPKRMSVPKSKNVLTNNTSGSIIKENNTNPITTITDNAISKVPKVSVDGFTDEQNIFIQNQHKDLLKYARDNNNNKEVAFVFRKDLADRVVFIGSDDVIDFGNGLDGKGDNLFVMHNHPRNSSFSKTDLDEFINNNNIKTLSIVKNNGEVEIITKSEKYSQREAYLYKERYKRKIAPNKTDAEYDKMVQKFLSYCERENIIRWIK